MPPHRIATINVVRCGDALEDLETWNCGERRLKLRVILCRLSGVSRIHGVPLSHRRCRAG